MNATNDEKQAAYAEQRKQWSRLIGTDKAKPIRGPVNPMNRASKHDTE